MGNASRLKFIANRQFNLAVKTLSIIHFAIIHFFYRVGFPHDPCSKHVPRSACAC
jgi:hypothetical protein